MTYMYALPFCALVGTHTDSVLFILMIRAQIKNCPRWPPVPQTHIDRSSQHGSLSAILEAAGCE